MTELEFDALVAALPKRTRPLSLGQRLKIPEAPNPFIAPTLQLLQPETTNPLQAEVIFIKASAAVGKSTIANHLSNVLRIPLLDLAKVPVSTGSLKALLLDVAGAGNPIKSFHSGNLPIIVDALDEGRLLSGEQGLESFLETTGEFLSEDRNRSDRTKLIFFGRYDSTEIAELWLDLAGNNLTTCKLEVAFFGEDAAWKLINAYADSTAAINSAYRHHPGPVRILIKAYFDAIESALGITLGGLWLSDQGRAFAGYAPVLAAMGSLLAQLDNFRDVANRLKETGTKEAWGVIDTVLHEIMDREKTKLCSKAEAQMSGPIPPETYDIEEQLTFLSQFIHGQPLKSSGRVKLNGPDQTKYQSMVKSYIPEHPFIRNKEFGNTVLGSVVIAHAIARDLLRSVDLERTARFSSQPFLWRAFSQNLSNGQSIDGRYVGYILNSLWNDPIQSNCRVAIDSSVEKDANVSIFHNKRRTATFTTKTPITFYAQIRDCEVDLNGDIKLLGDGPSSATAFYGRGSSIVICSAAEIYAASIRLEGNLWFEAETASTPPQFQIFVLNGAKVGWGGNLANRHPWSEIAPTLDPPYDDAVPDNPLTALAVALARRLPPGASLILNQNFTTVTDDPRMRWATRQFSTQLPALMKLLIAHGVASSEPLDASGTDKKVRVRFDFAWWNLVAALENPSEFSSWQPFIAEARRQIH